MRIFCVYLGHLWIRTDGLIFSNDDVFEAKCLHCGCDTYEAVMGEGISLSEIKQSIVADARCGVVHGTARGPYR